jgi:hypothetical protein
MNMWNRETAPWIVCLALSAVLVGLLELGRGKPRHHHTVAAHVFAAVVIWIALAALFRLVAYLVARAGGAGRSGDT